MTLECPQSLCKGCVGIIAHSKNDNYGVVKKNKHANKKQRLGRGTVGKTAVIGMRERGQRNKAKVIRKVDGMTLHANVHEPLRVVQKSTLTSTLAIRVSGTTTCTRWLIMGLVSIPVTA